MGSVAAVGWNTRFSGREKAFIPVGGKRIIDRIYTVFSTIFEEIILVTNDPLKYLEWDIHIVTDLFPMRSSLTGIHAGLFYSSNPYIFAVACDTPFLKKALVETIVDAIEPNAGAIIPKTSAGMEPLCAAYSKQCLKTVEQHLAQQKFKIQLAIRSHRIKKIPEIILREKDPDLISFFNINTPADLARAEEMVAAKPDSGD